MGCIIAVAGKGGTGKTTISALLVRIIRDKKKGSVLAIDADPNNNLAESLGIIETDTTVADILDKIAANPDGVPRGMTKDRYLEYRIQSAIRENDGFDIISMGRPEGAGCYCYINNVLRDITGKLIRDYDYTVIDNEAGFEHLSRRTIRRADVLLVISDGTLPGLKAAERIGRIVDELKIDARRRLLIINRTDIRIDDKRIKQTGLDYIGSIPSDRSIEKISVDGGSLIDLEGDALVLSTLNVLGEKIWQTN